MKARGESPDRPRRWLGGWFRDTGILLLSQGMLTATATVVMVLLARHLSRRDFGLFSSFLGLSLALSFVIDTGLPGWLLREAAHDYVSLDSEEATRRAHTRLWSALHSVILVGTAVTAVTASLCVILGLKGTLVVAEVLFLAYVIELGCCTSLETELRARRRPGRVVACVMTEKVVLLAGILVVLELQLGLVGVALSFVVGGAARVAMAFGQTLRGSQAPRPPILAGAREVISKSAPFAGNTAAIAFFPRTDTALVSLVSVISASYFAIGYQVNTTLLLVPSIAASTLYPFLQRREGTLGVRRRIVMIMLAAGCAVAAIGYVLASWIVPLMFGMKYGAAVTTVRVMLLGVPFAFVTYALTAFLYSAKREKSVTKAIWLPSLLGSVCVFGGAALGGPVAAAAGYAIRYVGQLLAMAVLSSRVLRGPSKAEDVSHSSALADAAT